MNKISKQDILVSKQDKGSNIDKIPAKCPDLESKELKLYPFLSYICIEETK